MVYLAEAHAGTLTHGDVCTGDGLQASVEMRVLPKRQTVERLEKIRQ